jgi:hypothetical protein
MSVSDPTLVANVKGVPLLEGKCAVCEKPVRRFVRKTAVDDIVRSGLVKSTLSDEVIASLKEIKPRRVKSIRTKIAKTPKEPKAKAPKKEPKLKVKKTKRTKDAFLTAMSDTTTTATVAA